VTSSSEYEASIKETNPLVRRIVELEHQPPDSTEIRTLQISTRKQKADCPSERLEQVKNSLLAKAKRATEKGSSNWLTMIPLKRWITISIRRNLEMQSSCGTTRK